MDTDHIPTHPTYEAWEERRRTYDELWSEVIHPAGSNTNQHSNSLKIEVERCFCAGAYVAAIVLSAAMVEVHLSHYGAWKNPRGQGLLEWLNVTSEWERLKALRNNLIHGVRSPSEEGRLDSDRYERGRTQLRSTAEFAIELSLRVVLNNPPVGSNPLR